MSKLKIYLQFCRPFTLLPPVLGILSGSAVAWGAKQDILSQSVLLILLKIMWGGLLAGILNAASNGLNQIFDLEIDKKNKPERPLTSGSMSMKEAWALTIFLYVAAVAGSFLLPLGCALMFVIAALCTIIYSAPPLRTKRHWLLASLTIAIPRGVLLKVAGWGVLRDIRSPEPWYIGAIFGLFLVGATTTKDYADIKGDKEGGCSTLPIRFGVKKSAWIIAPFFILPFFMFSTGVFLNILTGNRFLLHFLGASLSVWGCFVVYSILKNPEALTATENHPSWRQMYLMMMYAQIGLAVAYCF